nr:thiopeptide-type bacteriocin biosynthesis protein [Myroides sp. NP-2]
MYHLKRKIDKVSRVSGFVPGSSWLYYKIYVSVRIAEEVLVKSISPLVDDLCQKKIIKKWFFLKYRDTDFHIRIRFELNEKFSNNIQQVIDRFNFFIKNFLDSNQIWKIDLSTYERELERYNWESIDLAESFFYYDSRLILQLISKTKEDNIGNLLWLFSLRCIDRYLDLFEFSLLEKQGIMCYLTKYFKRNLN